VVPPADKTAEFWRQRRVLLTGHTGFKGAWLSLWLRELGADVTGYALAPPTALNLWRIVGEGTRSVLGDIRDEGLLHDTMRQADPQIVIHMAAQALVRESYRDPLGTYATNVLGTAHVLQGCRPLPHLQAVVIVTSDKVYENRDRDRVFEEGDTLGGDDPYSNSKACAELLTASFRESFFRDGPAIATARAGNVIGGGDWSVDRLIPDCVRALLSWQTVSLRYPEAVRPWQHVLEPLSGYLELAQALAEDPERAPRAVNFGPADASSCSVGEVVDAFSTRFDGRPGWTRDAAVHPPEARALRLSSRLAERALGWRASLDMADSLSWTADWYKSYMAGADMLEYSQKQITRYRQLAGARS
jgi:CDP-glucose 4,6-dehydratase